MISVHLNIEKNFIEKVEGEQTPLRRENQKNIKLLMKVKMDKILELT
jgi:hypothetical protein